MELGFQSVESFIIHLAEAAIAVRHEEHKMLEKVAVLVENDAKKRIGSYQETVGPFQDWAPLAESTEDEKARLGYDTGAPLLREGDLRESIEHEVKGLDAVIGSKMDIAAYQEFGTDKIPPRPFIGPAAFANKEKIREMLGVALIEGITLGKSIHSSLGYGFEI